MRWLRRYWIVFSVAVVLMLAVGFGTPQGVALWLGEPGDGFVAGTYSETLAPWLGRLWLPLMIGLLVFAVWFPLHLRRWWPWERPREQGRRDE